MKCASFFLIMLMLNAAFAGANSVITPRQQHITENDYIKYVGTCPCPYNLDKAGSLCGNRSAWCMPSSYKPVCDLTKVSYELIEVCEGK